MDRILVVFCLTATLFALSCPEVSGAPVMSYFNVSNKPIRPRDPPAKKIIPLPYREPAPVHEEPEEPSLARTFVMHYAQPIKYGFVNTKTRVYDPIVAYNYNRRFIYTNLIY